MLLQVDLQLLTYRLFVLQFAQFYSLFLHAAQSHSRPLHHLFRPLHLHPLLLHLHLTLVPDCFIEFVAQISYFLRLEAVPLPHPVNRMRGPRSFLLHLGDPLSCHFRQSFVHICHSLANIFHTFLNSSFSLSDLSLISTILSYFFLVSSRVLLCLSLSISIYLMRLIKFCVSSCERCQTSCTSNLEYLCFFMLF